MAGQPFVALSHHIIVAWLSNMENREEKRGCCREKGKGKQTGCERQTWLIEPKTRTEKKRGRAEERYVGKERPTSDPDEHQLDEDRDRNVSAIMARQAATEMSESSSWFGESRNLCKQGQSRGPRRVL